MQKPHRLIVKYLNCFLLVINFAPAQEIKTDYKVGNRVKCDPTGAEFEEGAIKRISGKERVLIQTAQIKKPLFVFGGRSKNQSEN